MKNNAKIGDKALIKVHQENRSCGYNPAPDGTEVEIVSWLEKFYGRTRSFGKEPGIYDNHLWPIVKFPDGSTSPISSFHLDSDKQFWFDSPKKRDLPELPFYEWDEVECLRPNSNVFKVIVNVKYEHIGQKCNDGVTPYPIYDVAPDRKGGMYTWFREDELKLIKRGPIYKYFHGEKIEFSSLMEECDFHYTIGKYEDIRNPRNNLYSWTKDEMIESAKEGICDCMSISQGLFGTGPHLHAIRFTDRSLGERARNYFIENMKEEKNEL